MVTKIAINGFGRIGRCITRQLFSSTSDLELVAINDLTDNPTLGHLLQFDSIHRTWGQSVSADDKSIRIGDKRIAAYAEKDPAKLPWKELGVQIVLECTGRFTEKGPAEAHIKAGAERVIISAPAKGVDATFCVGINSSKYDREKHRVVSNASCTTNCLAPIAKVVHESFGIIKGHMLTVHSYTADQRLMDSPHSDLRRARAATLSMVPTSTGAAKAIGLVIPELEGKLDGAAIRVPTPTVSLTCLTAHVSKKTSRDEVNAALKAAADGPLKGILGFEPRPVVSSDFIGDARSSIVDAGLTQVVGEDLVEVQSWYDNEWGFARRMIDLASLMAK